MAIGFIGLGDIGMPMARRVLAAGHELVAWNRSRDKLERLCEQGARPAGSPAELMARCDLVGLCLTSQDAVREVAFGLNGLFDGEIGGQRKRIADFSTGAAEAAVEFSRLAEEKGCGWVDAPVSGGVPGAEKGTLIVFAGGEEADIASLKPLFDSFSARVTHMGSAGAGQLTKICNQMIVASSLLVVAEAMAAGRAAGIAVDRLPAALQGGFADSIPFQIFGPRMAAHSFTPRLGSIDLMKKDLLLARDMAGKAGADTPIAALCAELYGRAEDGSADLSAAIQLFEGPL